MTYDQFTEEYWPVRLLDLPDADRAHWRRINTARYWAQLLGELRAEGGGGASHRVQRVRASRGRGRHHRSWWSSVSKFFAGFTGDYD